MPQTKQPGEASIESQPVTPDNKDNSMRNALIGGTVLALGAAGLFLWNANRDREPISPTPSPTPTVEVTATPRISPSPEAVETPYPTLGPDEYMTKGGLIMKIATPSASPRK